MSLVLLITLMLRTTMGRGVGERERAGGEGGEGMVCSPIQKSKYTTLAAAAARSHTWRRAENIPDRSVCRLTLTFIWKCYVFHDDVSQKPTVMVSLVTAELIAIQYKKRHMMPNAQPSKEWDQPIEHILHNSSKS